MKHADVAKSLWTAANAIAAYAVAQGVFLAYKLSELDFRQHFARWDAAILAVAMILFGAAVLHLVLFKCSRHIVSINEELRDVAWAVHRWRAGAVWLYSGVLPVICLIVPKVCGAATS